MGNIKHKGLKEAYVGNKYNLKESRKDQLLGLYNLILFPSQGSNLFIQKVLNPADYDQYTDVNELVKKLSTLSPYICDFQFVEYNIQNQDQFDLLFEFGGPVSVPFTNESEVWVLIEHVVHGLMFLEGDIQHYPFLHKNYIVQCNDKRYKLVNPYCFPDYLKEVVQVYLNPQYPIRNRKIYSLTQIRRNIREFGVLIITLMQSQSVQRLLKEPNYWFEVLNSMKNQISPELVNFVSYLMTQSQNMPQNFNDVKKWLVGNKKKQGNNVNNSPIKMDSANSNQRVKINIMDMAKEISNKPVSNNKIVSNGSLNDNEMRGRPFSLTDLCDIKYKPSISTDFDNFSPVKNPVILSDKRDVQNNESCSALNKNSNNIDNRVLFMNASTLIDPTKKPNDMEFINHAPVKNQNMTSYFKRHSDISIDILALAANETNKTNNTGNVINVNTATQNKQGALTDNRVHSMENLMQEPKPQITGQNSLPDNIDLKFVTSQQKSNKQIQRVLIKWVSEKGNYQKILEYTDGTTEAVNMDVEENKQYISSELRYNSKPQTPTPFLYALNHQPMDKGPAPLSLRTTSITKDYLVMLLCTDFSQPSSLLFKTLRNKDTTFFKPLTSVVDLSNPVRPSLYHKVDDIDIEVNRSRTQSNVTYGVDNKGIDGKLVSGLMPITGGNFVKDKKTDVVLKK